MRRNEKGGAKAAIDRSRNGLSGSLKMAPRLAAADNLVSQLEKAQKQYTLDRFLGQLERAHLLICDELGYISLSRGGVELLFRVFAERYERASVLVTSNLPFSEWNQIFQGERMTAALLDRLTHRCHIFEMNGESYRFRESMKLKKAGNRSNDQIAVPAQNGHLQERGGSLLDDQGGSLLGDHFQTVKMCSTRRSRSGRIGLSSPRS